MSCAPSRLIQSLDSDPNLMADARSDTLDFYDVDVASYPRTYNFLKQQREELSAINATIKENLDSYSPQDKKQLDFLLFLTDSLLLCDFGSVFLSASNSIPAVQNVISSQSSSPQLIQLASSILAVSLRLSQIFTYVSCTLPTSCCADCSCKDGQAKKPPVRDNSNDQMLVLCRICEEYVPIEMIEDHSKNCVIAYESEFTMITTDEKIKKLQKAIRNSILNEKWPGTAKKTISTLLPMLHVTMLLDVAISGDKLSLNHASLSLFKIEIPDASPSAFSLLEKAKELITEKIRATYAFDEASAVLQKTRISGNVSGAPSLQTTIADFLFIKRISSGAFAKVYIAVKVRTGDIYAIKVTPKLSVKQKNQFKRVLTEKDILLQNSNPFIVDFYYSIIGEHNLYLVMEYLSGGDLYSLLHNIGSLDEKDARTYTAQIVKALEYLHSHGIVHRDLKPDNILVNVNGKLKLTDFGLSLYGAFDRSIPDDNKSLVGTPDYLAPEIILSHPHSFSADYWSLGVVIYEFLTGEPPFHRETESQTFGQILSGNFDLEYLEGMSPEVIDLIKRLLTVDPEKRLGSSGIKEIMSHPWFKDLDWDHIDDLDPVFVPEQKDKLSVSYFTERYTFQKTDGIEKDILDDIEIAKTEAPHSVSMTDLSSRNSFASRLASDEEESDDEDDMSMFPSIALQNLSRKTVLISPTTMHKRSNSVSTAAGLVLPEEAPLDLISSRSFVSCKRIGSPPVPNWNIE